MKAAKALVVLLLIPALALALCWAVLGGSTALPADWVETFLRPASRGPAGVFWFLFQVEEYVVRQVQGPGFYLALALPFLAEAALLVFILKLRRRAVRLTCYAALCLLHVASGLAWQRFHHASIGREKLTLIGLHRVAPQGGLVLPAPDGLGTFTCDTAPILDHRDLAYLECRIDGPTNFGLYFRPNPGGLSKLGRAYAADPEAYYAIVVNGEVRGDDVVRGNYKSKFFKLGAYPRHSLCRAALRRHLE